MECLGPVQYLPSHPKALSVPGMYCHFLRFLRKWCQQSLHQNLPYSSTKGCRSEVFLYKDPGEIQKCIICSPFPRNFPTFHLDDENPTFRLDDENPTFRPGPFSADGTTKAIDVYYFDLKNYQTLHKIIKIPSLLSP